MHSSNNKPGGLAGYVELLTCLQGASMDEKKPTGPFASAFDREIKQPKVNNLKEDDMLKKSVMLFASACVAIFIMANLAAAPQAFAQQQQQASERDATMVKCIAEARKQFTNDSEDMQRADWYKACMARAGFQP